MTERKVATTFQRLGSVLSTAKQGLGQLLQFLDHNEAARSHAVADWAKTLEPGATLVDIGAGSCKYAPYFSHCKYTPQDSPEAEYASPTIPLLRSDISAIPLPSGSVDAILCTEVLEHVEQPLDALSEFARLLKPGGRLLLSVPAACRVHRVPTHYYGGFAPDFFERSLPARGLDLERLQPVGNWSQFMAQEIGRLPSLVRDHTSLPRPVATAIAAGIWPIFRVAIPTAFLALSHLDRSEDLPLGWIAYARRA